MRNIDRVKTYPVAASAYMKGRNNPKDSLTHSCVGAGHDFHALCRNVKPANILDDDLWSGDEKGIHQKPSCETCLKRDPRFTKQKPTKAVAAFRKAAAKRLRGRK